MRIVCQKDDSKILLKNGFLKPKQKNWGWKIKEMKLFEKKEFEKLFANYIKYFNFLITLK